MRDVKKCGHCRYHRFSKTENEWICMNVYSEAYGCETEYDEVCSEYLAFRERLGEIFIKNGGKNENRS